MSRTTNVSCKLEHILHPIKGKNRYCGPSAIATILGVTTDHAARVIRGLTGERQVKGVSVFHLRAAMERLGMGVRYTSLNLAYESLADWLKCNLQAPQTSYVILQFGVPGESHVGTIHGGKYQCNLTNGPVSFDAIPFKPNGGIVFGLFEVLDLPGSSPEDSKVVDRKLLAKAQRIASRHGIVIASEHGSYGSFFDVSCPELEHDDPLEGRNSTDDVRTVLALVEEYRDCLMGGYLDAVTDPRMMN